VSLLLTAADRFPCAQWCTAAVPWLARWLFPDLRWAELCQRRIVGYTVSMGYMYYRLLSLCFEITGFDFVRDCPIMCPLATVTTRGRIRKSSERHLAQMGGM
jgi:hypothetical protein